MDYTSLIALIVAVIIWTVIYYAGKWAQTGQPIDYFDLGATFIVAIVVGLVAFLTNNGITQADLVTQLETYTTVIAFIDYFLKAVYNYLKPPVSSPRNIAYLDEAKKTYDKLNKK
jgi:hypothetical protein